MESFYYQEEDFLSFDKDIRLLLDDGNINLYPLFTINLSHIRDILSRDYPLIEFINSLGYPSDLFVTDAITYFFRNTYPLPLSPVTYIDYGLTRYSILRRLISENDNALLPNLEIIQDILFRSLAMTLRVSDFANSIYGGEEIVPIYVEFPMPRLTIFSSTFYQ